MKDFKITLRKLNGREIARFEVPCRMSRIDNRPSEQDIINRIVEMGYNLLLYTFTVDN